MSDRSTGLPPSPQPQAGCPITSLWFPSSSQPRYNLLTEAHFCYKHVLVAYLICLPFPSWSNVFESPRRLTVILLNSLLTEFHNLQFLNEKWIHQVSSSHLLRSQSEDTVEPIFRLRCLAPMCLSNNAIFQSFRAPLSNSGYDI